MTTKQFEFLELYVLQGMNYSDISNKLDVNKQTLSEWWIELKPERDRLSSIKKLWKRKCVNVSLVDFKAWYESTQRTCYYCKIKETEIQELLSKKLIRTKRIVTRGKRLELERLSPNSAYDDLNNLVFCCYWCNNAKTDEFSAEEFKYIGQLIGNIWNNRLRVARLSETDQES